ncbi:hypothetical protein AB0K48_57720, partial [Nonomuraea sp. NPDC055795]
MERCSQKWNGAPRTAGFGTAGSASPWGRPNPPPRHLAGPVRQGREYDVTIVLHPLSGRRDATA